MEQPVGRGMGGRRKATRTILAVGSDRDSLHRVAQQLGTLGYLVVLGHSGSQALELIAARGFDLILLDTQAADTIGLHVLREIRGARDTADLPVVLLSSGAGNAAELQAFAVGADDCLTKPVAFDILAARLERTLARSLRIEELKRSNLALDARIAARAMELGEMKVELAAAQAEKLRLAASLHTLQKQARAVAA
ncbi:response regulator [Sphingomonas sp. M1-B02]|uniref:response regulator n=1 Tax=Sphingomonas sp. M1-B02 TaxID=3114300 RepID=UPI0022409BB8|nr:response regulator [Sphingomonas sp. S6-11]UZK65027.1 response regulator [Sphingomonas sp. S6-11]